MKEEIIEVEEKIDKPTLEYDKAKIYKRLLATFIDLFIIVILTFAAFSLSNMAIKYFPFYIDIIDRKTELEVDSNLFTEDHQSIIDYTKNEEVFKTYTEKKDYLKDKINLFYTSDFVEDKTEALKEYDERKLAYKVDNISLFEYKNNEVIERSEKPEYYYTFYQNEINDQCLKTLYNNVDYISCTQKIFLTSLVNFVIWLIVFFTIFYLLIPLVFFKRGRQTIGMKIFRIGLIDGNALNISIGKYFLRYGFLLFVMLILDFFAFLLPLIVSISMMYFTKTSQDLVDYIFNNYMVDVKNSEIYLNYLEYIDREETKKKVKLENKDFNITK